MELPQQADRMTAISVSLKGQKEVFEGKQADLHDGAEENLTTRRRKSLKWQVLSYPGKPKHKIQEYSKYFKKKLEHRVGGYGIINMKGAR